MYGINFPEMTEALVGMPEQIRELEAHTKGSYPPKTGAKEATQLVFLPIISLITYLLLPHVLYLVSSRRQRPNQEGRF